jgi:hypothetical protein
LPNWLPTDLILKEVMTGGGSTGIERYNRTTALFQSFSAGDSIAPKTILRYQMRDFADPSGVPYQIPYQGSINGAPYGYIPANLTICRVSTASAAVMQGIGPGESANMSTFWVLLGNPATGIVVPYWLVGAPPTISSDLPKAALNDTANAIFDKLWGGSSWPSYIKSHLLRNYDGSGLLRQLFAAEGMIFASADSLLALWRNGQCTPNDLLTAEGDYAGMAMAAMSASLRILNAVSRQPLTLSMTVPPERLNVNLWPNMILGIQSNLPAAVQVQLCTTVSPGAKVVSSPFHSLPGLQRSFSNCCSSFIS